MARKQEKAVFVNKQLGETPLEALARYRATRPDLVATTPMTYAGRLDPMASGTLLVLGGDECKNKDKYLALDKEYEIEVLFGMTTDTYDALGLATLGDQGSAQIDVAKYVGKIAQEYPAYSSKTVDGIQLHELARAGNLPEEMPVKEVEIYSIEKIGERKIGAADLQKE
ncbi:MAG: truB, partial [Candidatus Parcubacteria bacterium]|nr:truB [Candidatus Parcubacteria bacterium]